MIAGVLKERPGKWFGCLAYFNVATPPAKGRVHPRLVPYITYDRSLLCDAMLRGGPVQGMAAPGPGRYVAVAWVYAPAGQTGPGTVELTLTPLDEQGRNPPGYSSGTAPPPTGRWSPVTLIATVPETVAGSKVARLRLVPIVDGFQAGGRVYLDDVGLYRLD